jgi:cyclophilin family peptidyl-prolyl cis-trans isomerase
MRIAFAHHAALAQLTLASVACSFTAPIAANAPPVNSKLYAVTSSRRQFLGAAPVAGLVLIASHPVNAAVPRAVGGTEEACRAANNCLETGEWDGAVGWSWGAKDRCDPSDAQCGANGRVGPLQGKAVPQLPSSSSSITHFVSIRVDVGRAESGVLKLGLYGKDCPGSVQEMVDFCSSGIVTLIDMGNTIGKDTIPVSLSVGGVVSSVTPGLSVTFGVPSQANAYGRSLGLSKTTDFIPQKKPDFKAVAADNIVRLHDCAGLLSISQKGIGYGGTGFELDDETFEASFLITGDAAPTLDKTRRVIGQVLDTESMAFLERLLNLPTKRGVRGVIQANGPPLLKVTVNNVAVTNT